MIEQIVDGDNHDIADLLNETLEVDVMRFGARTHPESLRPKTCFTDSATPSSPFHSF